MLKISRSKKLLVKLKVKLNRAVCNHDLKILHTKNSLVLAALEYIV